MSENIFSITSDVLPASTHLVGFKGKEGLSELYAFELGLLIADPAFDQDGALRGRAAVELHLGPSAQPYKIHGILSVVELLHQFGDKALYRALLVPKLWQALLTHHSRVWTDQKIPDVLRQVLEASGLASDEYRLVLDDESVYPVMEFVAQYKESNYAFLSRWMEREGMYFYFEHGDAKEVLVIVDGKCFADSDPKPTVKYRPLSEGDHMAIEAFDSFKARSTALPASVELIDYNYLNPNLDVRATTPVVETSFGEISRFGDNFGTPDDGKRLAKVRAQELLARQKVFHARGRAFHLRSGYPFGIEDHPRAELNDLVYLACRIRHWGNQSAELPQARKHLGLEDIDGTYLCEVEAIAGSVQYRAPDRFPWPRIEGYEMATVCGAADSKYAQIDEHGRYRVSIKFDESDLAAGQRSAWVRMMQPYGGTNEGFHFPLLKGTEVLLFFSGGDPDRPVIAGVVPNPLTPSPVINNNHTQNIIQTVNLNLIKIEDTLNQQFIYVYCPVENTWIHMGVTLEGFNLVLNTEGHVHFNFGGDQVIDVNLTLTENVQLDVTFNYYANWLVNITVDNNIEIGGNLEIHVVGDVHYNFDANWAIVVLADVDLDVTGVWITHVCSDVSFTFDSNWTVICHASTTYTIDGDFVVNVTGNTNIGVTNNYTLNVDASHTEIVLGPRSQTVNNTYNITVAGAVDEKFWDFHAKINGGITSDTFIGIKNENLIGGKIETLIGLKIEAMLALHLSVRAGAHLEMDGSVNLGETPCWLTTAGAKIEGGATWISEKIMNIIL